MHVRAIRQPQRHRLSLRFRQGESPERRSLRSQCRHAGVDGGGVWLDARSQPPRRCARRGHARTCEPVYLRTRALAGSHARFFSKCCGRRVRQGPPVSRGHLRSGKTHDRIQRRLSACPSNATFGKESHREQAWPDQSSPAAGKATIDFGALHRFPPRRACVPIAVSTVAGARAHAADPGWQRERFNALTWLVAFNGQYPGNARLIPARFWLDSEQVSARCALEPR